MILFGTIAARLASILLSVAIILIFLYAPEEATLGIIQKIFYIHVPLAWWGFVSYFLIFLSSIFYIKTNRLRWDCFAKANAEIGVLFTVLTLITGMIWGKISWGVWWTWDPRLTTAFILFFVYAGYLLIYSLSLHPAQRRKISAVLGIIAFINVPLVFFSARLWRSIHPAVFTAKSTGLSPTILTIFLFTLGSMFFLWVTLVLCRFNQLYCRTRLNILQHSHKEVL